MILGDFFKFFFLFQNMCTLSIYLTIITPFLRTWDLNGSPVNSIASKVGSFVIVHHEIVQEQHQIEAFTESRLTRHQLMDSTQMEVKSERMHMYRLTDLKHIQQLVGIYVTKYSKYIFGLPYIKLYYYGLWRHFGTKQTSKSFILSLS